MHARDIATLLGKGVIDVGFTGLDLIVDTQVVVRPVVRLDMGKVKVALLVPNTDPSYHPFHLLHKTIATPFPNLAKAYFDHLKIDVKIHPIQGASEGIPYLGIADAIVDVVETGESAAGNGLKIIADDIFVSECIGAVNKPEIQVNYQIINNFLRKIYS
jgi:ATP phosphoribosyltransferase